MYLISRSFGTARLIIGYLPGNVSHLWILRKMRQTRERENMSSSAAPTVHPGNNPDPFSPVRLGPIQLKNRIIKAATSEGRSPEGLVTDDLIDFHRSFIRGGAGLTTVAYCCVAPEGATAPGQILMSPKALPGLKRLTDAIHQEGGAVSAQLGHGGMV